MRESTSDTLRVLREDEHLLFVDKPAGIVVQQSQDPDEQHLYEIVDEYLRSKGEQAFLLQRLDRGTTGVMFFSKSNQVNVHISRQFEKKRIRKTYVAICEGVLSETQLIDAPIGRVGAITFGVLADGKKALTRVEPVASREGRTLVRVRLLTGRTHQIRVHLSALGHALDGDWLYGTRDEGRPMLHAHKIEMTHPATGEPLVVAAPLPEDFYELFPDISDLLVADIE
jgi:23S rRNA pseudouridine1911/1915/1917 synthase